MDTAVILTNWEALNAGLMKLDEEECKKLLAIEKRGRCRRQFVLRIDARIRRLANHRNRLRLLAELDARGR